MSTGASAEIKLLLDETMSARGWSSRTILDLPPIFAGDREVTSFFRCADIPCRAAGCFVIEGGIGVLHTGFEANWARDPMREPKIPGFAMLLHTANLSELDDVRYLQTPDPVAVARYSDRIVSMLIAMPNTIDELRRMYREGRLANRPLQSFAGYSHRSKHAAFMVFLGTL